jgi:flagellar basal body-associated protein FliL
MTNENESEGNNHESRNMWIAVAVIIVLLVGGMGVNMLVHHDAPTETAQTSGSSQ